MALSTTTIRPSSNNSPASWTNIGNAHDSDGATYASWGAAQNPSTPIFTGFSHGLGANEEIFSVKLNIKYSTSGYSNDTLSIGFSDDGSNWQELFWTEGPNIGATINDPETITIEVLGPPENPTNNLWTKTIFNNLQIRFVSTASAKADSVTIRIYDVNAEITYYDSTITSVLSVFSTASLDGDVNDSDNDGSGNSVDTSSVNRWVGIDYSTVKEVYRGFDSFDISSIPANSTIEDATLEWAVDTTLYDAGAGNNRLPNIASALQVDHVNYGASLDASDWQLTAITDTMAELFAQKFNTYTIRVTYDERLYGVKTGVGTAVQADYDAARSTSQFRTKYADAAVQSAANSDNYTALITRDATITPESRYDPRLRVAYTAPVTYTKDESAKASVIGIGTSDVSSLAALGSKIYTREVESSLQTTTDTNLSTSFTSSEVSDVDSDDATRITTTGQGYLVHMFKVKNDNNTEQINLSWNGQTSLDPSTSTVYLQIYNRNSTTWETIDSYTTATIDTDFTMSGNQTTNLSNYYDSNYWVSCRVYQANV